MTHLKITEPILKKNYGLNNPNNTWNDNDSSQNYRTYLNEKQWNHWTITWKDNF